jgi:hypothetical protein
MSSVRIMFAISIGVTACTGQSVPELSSEAVQVTSQQLESAPKRPVDPPLDGGSTLTDRLLSQSARAAGATSAPRPRRAAPEEVTRLKAALSAQRAQIGAHDQTTLPSP